MLLEHDWIREARLQDDRWSVGVEAVRTVNNCHLKLNAKISDPFNALEPDLGKARPRETIRRGTVQLSILLGRASPEGRGLPPQHRVALAAYRQQIAEMERVGGDRGGRRRLALPLPAWSRSGGRRPTTRATTGPPSSPSSR